MTSATWVTRVLVVANQTAASEELRTALAERARNGPVVFTLLLPSTPTAREHAGARLEAVLEALRASGLAIEGRLGADSDPCVAVHEAWDPATYDEIVVSTLPTGVSKWLQVDTPHRIARLTDAPVTHVVAHGRPAASAA